jgi:hypothetical protein
VAPAFNEKNTQTATTNDGLVQLSGRIYAGSTASDLPLSNAEVVVVASNGTKTTRSSQNGFYALTVPSGDVTITATKPGYEAKTTTIDAAADVVLNFSLSAGS